MTTIEYFAHSASEIRNTLKHSNMELDTYFIQFHKKKPNKNKKLEVELWKHYNVTFPRLQLGLRYFISTEHVILMPDLFLSPNFSSPVHCFNMYLLKSGTQVFHISTYIPNMKLPKGSCNTKAYKNIKNLWIWIYKTT